MAQGLSWQPARPASARKVLFSLQPLRGPTRLGPQHYSDASTCLKQISRQRTASNSHIHGMPAMCWELRFQPSLVFFQDRPKFTTFYVCLILRWPLLDTSDGRSDTSKTVYSPSQFALSSADRICPAQSHFRHCRVGTLGRGLAPFVSSTN
jgi:hypothetical protein